MAITLSLYAEHPRQLSPYLDWHFVWLFEEAAIGHQRKRYKCRRLLLCETLFPHALPDEKLHLTVPPLVRVLLFLRYPARLERLVIQLSASFFKQNSYKCLTGGRLCVNIFLLSLYLNQSRRPSTRGAVFHAVPLVCLNCTSLMCDCQCPKPHFSVNLFLSICKLVTGDALCLTSKSFCRY